MAKTRTRAPSRNRDWRSQDPHYKRESANYPNPVPSREFILSYLSQRGMTLSCQALCKAWQLNELESEVLAYRLKAMVRDGQLVLNRRQGYGIPAKMDLIKGRVIGHADGHGFLRPEDGSGDLYIPPRHMRPLLHGDRIVAHIRGIDRRGRREAALVEILERHTQRLVGRYFQESGIGFVIADNQRIHHEIAIPPEHHGGARPGQIVVVELLEQPSKHNPPIGRVREILGEHMAPGMEVQIALYSHDIPFEWPQAALDQADHHPQTVPEAAKQGRLDVRTTPLVTIDGATARDFDDAVYCERRGDNWYLLVAIADVAEYVQPHSALDQEAQKRGTSVYFPDRVIPMLPEALSNGLCSLNPQVDRLCLVAQLTINRDGKIIRSRFREAVMRSHARLTYDTVAAMVVDHDPEVRRQHPSLVAHLDQLYTLYQVLRQARERRHAIDFDTQETVIEYNPERKIERIIPSERNDAHRLIEECMIAANVAAARFLLRHRMPTLYRVHEGPSLDRLEKLRGVLGELGLTLGGGDKPRPGDYATLLNSIRERADHHLIQTMLLRTLAQAVYTPDNQGHFGLALDAYAHFTSPIRRYPDLLVHRAIRHVLGGGKAKDFIYTAEAMVSLGDHTSMTERRADDATRDAIEWLKCEFMLDKVGDTFSGTISGVMPFGLFVSLDEVFVEGLIHVTALSNDYYHFDPAGQRLYGERSGMTYRLGDRLRVKVARVDLDERKIDFDPLFESRKPKKKRAQRP